MLLPPCKPFSQFNFLFLFPCSSQKPQQLKKEEEMRDVRGWMRQPVWEWRCWWADFSFQLSINTITWTKLSNLYVQLPLPEAHNVLHNIRSVAFLTTSYVLATAAWKPLDLIYLQIDKLQVRDRVRR